jgi:hypothetical protein
MYEDIFYNSELCGILTEFSSTGADIAKGMPMSA